MKTLLFFIFSFSLCADLSLSKSLISHQAKLGEKVFKKTFTVTNTSNASLRITKIEQSCSCTNVSIDKKTLSQGQSATVSFQIKYKKNRGLQKNTITFYTDQNKQHTLTVKVTIPEEIDVQPRFMFWSKKLYNESRTAEINIHQDFNAKFIKAELVKNKNLGSFSLTSEKLSDKSLRIHVKPTGAYLKRRPKVALHFIDKKSKKEIIRYVYLFVK